MTAKRGLSPMDDAIQRWMAAFEKVGIESYSGDNDAFASGALCYAVRGGQLGLWVPVPVENNIITRRWVWVRFSERDVLAWALLDCAGVEYMHARSKTGHTLRIEANADEYLWSTPYETGPSASLAALVLECIEYGVIKRVDLDALARMLILE